MKTVYYWNLETLAINIIRATYTTNVDKCILALNERGYMASTSHSFNNINVVS